MYFLVSSDVYIFSFFASGLSHHVGGTSVRGAPHRLDELLDDELNQVDPVLADLEALVKCVFSKVDFKFSVVTCSQILENDLRMDGR